jgi:tetratricopeptide (TPR) repeat protein
LQENTADNEGPGDELSCFNWRDWLFLVGVSAQVSHLERLRTAQIRVDTNGLRRRYGDQENFRMPSVIAIGNSRVHLPDRLAASYVEGARRLREVGRINEAEMVLREAIKFFPDIPNLLFDYARLAEAQRDWAEVAERWHNARVQFPQHETGYLGEAGALRELGRLDEADAALKEAMAWFPDETVRQDMSIDGQSKIVGATSGHESPTTILPPMLAKAPISQSFRLASLPKVIVFGHSHMAAMLAAFDQQTAAADKPFELLSYQFLRENRQHIINVGGKWRYHPECEQELRLLIEQNEPAVLVSMLQGEQAISSGLIAPQEPFNFYFPDDEDNHEENNDQNVIPFDIVLRMAKHQYQVISSFLDSTRTFMSMPTFALCPPPPIDDEEFILTSNPKHANIAEHLEPIREVAIQVE